LKLNLGVRIARYPRFAAAAKQWLMSDVLVAQAWLRGLGLQLAKQTGKFETIN
jgi:hypothetical protein